MFPYTTQCNISLSIPFLFLSKRQRNAILASQKKTTDRLTALNSVSAVGGTAKEFRCSDGITVMPYIVDGNLSVNVKRCNFVVIHDFFDTADATSLLMKNITAHHDGCQALCFNYPGQSNTVWPRLPVAERERGALGGGGRMDGGRLKVVKVVQ